MSQLLNYKLEGKGDTIVLLHGLFGNLDNLGLLARDFRNDHQVLSIDLRNHGHSFHSDSHTYYQQADDVITLINHLNIKQCVIIGHSMGGKVAMKVAETLQERITKLIVMDMAPVTYHVRRHDNVFAGLKAVLEGRPTSRSQAMQLMAKHIEIDGVRQFLSKSLFKEEDILAWRFNVEALISNYDEILGWDPICPTAVPTLFLKGGDSDYLTSDHQSLVQQQFSQAKAHIIANTGHWLHAEKPQEVIRAIRKFL
ncbi:alpha/beta fold hydrolase [Vibrio sonorensis]|uniref:alpha/beta fold hydrolase n=1 Tax=Vibrio sonorensis TaxID=1004316 RepID=UPI0008D92E02|nr:alpha/beta fold hydrolase [Vibrio sonorensis]